MQALMASAHRGVDVTLIVPRKNDSKFVALSSRSYYEDLMAAGVRIAEFKGGLLHTKSLLIDQRIAMFGSVNFDMRSLHLNFEISLLIYNVEFCERLNTLLQSYIKKSNFVDPITWAKRSRLQRLKENAGYLISPLL
jgi:cardiolipin synthase